MKCSSKKERGAHDCDLYDKVVFEILLVSMSFPNTTKYIYIEDSDSHRKPHTLVSKPFRFL